MKFIAVFIFLFILCMAPSQGSSCTAIASGCTGVQCEVDGDTTSCSSTEYSVTCVSWTGNIKTTVSADCEPEEPPPEW